MKLKSNWNITPWKYHKHGGIKQWRKKPAQNNQWFAEDYFLKKVMFCSTKKARFDKSTKKVRKFSAINKYYDF